MSVSQNPYTIQLKYGCNPHQIPAKAIFPGSGPLKILNGNPGYINLLDAISAWQLASELKNATGKTGAASFKHVSPAGAAVAQPVSAEFLNSQFLPECYYSDSALAYIRARAGDRMSSYGDVVAFSNSVDTTLANILKDEVSDLIIACTALKYTQSNSVCAAFEGQLIGTGAGQQSRIHCTRLACDKAEKWMLQFHPKTLKLKFKPDLKKPEMANIVNQYMIWYQLSKNEKKHMMKNLLTEPEPITCEEKNDWFKKYDNITISSDAFFPFRDNIDSAAKINAKYIIEPGGSIRDDDVIKAADEYNMIMAFTGIRCFLH